MRKNGKINVGHANDKEAYNYLVKQIKRFEEKTYQNEQKQAGKTFFEAIRFDWDVMYQSFNERERELYLSLM